MRQFCFLTPMLAFGCVTSCLADEASNASAPSLTMGALTLTPYGQFDQFIGRSVNNGNDASPGVAPDQKSKVDLLNGGLSTSNIGLRGRAKITDGADVTFDLSTFINPDSGTYGRTATKSVTVAGATFAPDPLFARAANLGFDIAEVGALKFGTDIAPMYQGLIRSNAFGSSMLFGPLSPLMYVNSGLSGGTNWEKAVFFNSRAIDGLSVRLAYSFGDSGSVYVSPGAANNVAGHSGRNFGLSATYENGPVLTNLNYQKVNRNNVIGNFSTSGLSVDNTSSWLAGLAYDFGPAKLDAHIGSIRDESSATSAFYGAHKKIYVVDLTVPVGNGDVLLGYGKRNVDGTVAATPLVAIDNAGAPGGNDGRKMATLGYKYRLFKSTELYTFVSSDRTATRVVDTSNGSVGDRAGSAVDFAVGGRFSF